MLTTISLHAETIKLATDHFPPWTIVDESGNVTGINVLTKNLLEHELAIEIEMTVCPFARCLKMIENGDADLILGLFKTPEREIYMEFVEPGYAMSQPKVFYLLLDQPDIESYEQLYSLHIGVVRNISYHPKFDNDQRLRKYAFTEDTQLVQTLENGRIDTFIGTRSVIDYMLLSKGKFKLFKKASFYLRSPRNNYFGVSRKSAFMQRVPEMSAAISRLKKANLFEQVERDWFEQANGSLDKMTLDSDPP